jgi:hypothetical protein
MHPGSPGSGNDPYGQQRPESDPFFSGPPSDPFAAPPGPGQPHSQPASGQPADPYAAPGYGQQPTSGQPYGDPYAAPGYGQQPTSGQPYDPYAPPGYGQPAPGVPFGDPYAAPAAPRNNLGLIGMILGIAAIPLVFCCYIGVPLGIAAVVLGVMGMNSAKAGAANNRTQALVSVICGGIALVLWVLILLLGLGSSLSN